MALQTYSVLDICKVYHTKIQEFRGGRWPYKLRVSLKFAKPTVQRNTNGKVDAGLTNLHCPWNLQRLPYKDTKFKGGRWRYKLIQFPWYLLSLPCKDTMSQVSTSTIQTYKQSKLDKKLRAYMVLEICKVYHTKIRKFKGGGWRWNLSVAVKFAKPTIQQYQNSKVDVDHTSLQWPGYAKIQKFKGGRWRYKLTVSLKFAKLTIQRYENSNCGRWHYTNLQCPWNLQSLLS